jgi:hypothetical protein
MEGEERIEERDVEEISEDVEETPPDFDPLLAQAERLPAWTRGSEGSNPNQHVRRPGPEDEDESVEEDSFGWTPPDPSKFTGD